MENYRPRLRSSISCQYLVFHGQRLFKVSLLLFYRGVYLASILFTDDKKLLVTLDENIPIIAVDDSHPSTFLQDFCWLMKVCLVCLFVGVHNVLCLINFTIQRENTIPLFVKAKFLQLHSYIMKL